MKKLLGLTAIAAVLTLGVAHADSASNSLRATGTATTTTATKSATQATQTQATSGQTSTQGTPAAASAASTSQPTAAAASQTITAQAIANPQLKTLSMLLQTAGLTETLNGTGPYTVFAPTDAAFAKLAAGTVENLTKPENREQLRQILTYHVVPGKVMASSITSGAKQSTVQGQQLAFNTRGSQVQVNGANIVKSDVSASNGVIHVIDTVLMPTQTTKATY